MRIIKSVARIAKAVFAVLLSLLLLLDLYFIAAGAISGEQPTLFGYSAAVVVSGSMSGTIEVDDLIIIHRQDGYSCGDIITYKNGGSLITHRITEITENGYITKGDANNAEDEPVSRESVTGAVVKVIPKAGVYISALKTPMGMFFIVLITALLIINPFGRKTGGKDDGEKPKK